MKYLVVPALLCLFAATSSADQIERINGIDWRYTISDNTAILGGGSSSSPAIPQSTTGDLVIPDSLGGYSVTSIGGYAFSGCSKLTSITIPRSVTSISSYAFIGCSNVETIIVDPNNPVYDSRNQCNAIIKSQNNELVAGCKTTTIPESVTRIGGCAFSGCSYLTAITIPDRVTSIGYKAFSNCSSLSSITIPDSVTSIGFDAFFHCRCLTNAIYNVSQTILWYVSPLTTGAFSIPDSVTSIGDFAFESCSLVTSVTIPYGVTNIGIHAFCSCERIQSVTISDSVKSIGMWAFHDCHQLKTLTIPDSVMSIGREAFTGCSGQLFETNCIPGLMLVDGWVVGYTSTLSGNVDLRGVRGIVDAAFDGCSILKSITIPDNMTCIGDYAFLDCSGLTSILIPNGVVSIGDYVFCGCSELTSFSLPDSVTSIGNWAFSGCSNLTSLEIPHAVAFIGDNAFHSCSKLKRMTIPGSVLFLGDNAFEECNSLESIQIPRHFENRGIVLTCPSKTAITFYDASTLETPIPVSYDWLDEFPALLSSHGRDYEATALSLAANGINLVWECYLAGLDPTNSNSVFTASIQIEHGKPCLSWFPDLGNARYYVVEGKTSLSNKDWLKDFGKDVRFFRIVVEPPKPHPVKGVVIHLGDV